LWLPEQLQTLRPHCARSTMAVPRVEDFIPLNYEIQLHLFITLKRTVIAYKDQLVDAVREYNGHFL
jgi:hypothetical protein